jgi:Rrf2 family transcriptional regulator, iron-sulfur cluster assembly transcription factor
MRLELTRRGDYAIRAVLALGRAEDGAVIAAPRLAALTGIPPRFVAQVMTEIVRAGIAEAKVGRSGGYRLTRDPAAISLLEVVEAVEGDPRRRVCVFSTAPCMRDGECDVHSVFAAAQDALLAELADVTIAELSAHGTHVPQGASLR